MDQYRVFGNPIKHSRSPVIHQHFASVTGQSLNYEKQWIEIDDFESEVTAFFNAGGKGLNITLPFKERAFQMAQKVNEEAAFAGAVNTLMMKDNILYGYNTDGVGLLEDLHGHLNWPTESRRILILGAGGASRGVLHPLIQSNPKEIVISNRTLSKAEDLVSIVKDKTQFDDIHYSPFEGLDQFDAFDLIINATSASLDNQAIKLPESICNERTACYDMAYGADMTVFLKWACTCGVLNTADGLGMLVEQAAHSFFLWTGVAPSTALIRSKLKEGLLV